MRFARNLTASEILDQALHFRRIEAIDHCVFMGMGEPMLNLDAVLAACERLPGHRHHAPPHDDLDGRLDPGDRTARRGRSCRCAWRCRCTPPRKRCARELMPVNERYPLADVIEACRAFYARRRRRVFVEYVMLAGVNDRYEQALELASLLGRRAAGAASIFKVNLIPLQPDRLALSRARAARRSRRSAPRSSAREIPVTVRLTRGRDIAAACGQLAARAA